MEASTAAPAAAQPENGQPVESQTDPAQQAPEGVDIGEWQRSVDQQLSQAADGIREMAQMQQTMISRLPEPEPEPGFEDQFAELFEQNGGLMDQQTLSGLQNLMQQQIQQGIQQAVAPLQQELGSFRQQMSAQELSSLQTEFPELQDQQVADGLAESVVNEAITLLPRGISEDAAEQLVDGFMQNKNFVRLVHLAEKAKGRIQQETPAGGTQPLPQVESGGGAAPATTSGADEWDSFVQSRRPLGGSVW